MVKDASWKEYLSDNERYADLINGLGCKGRQVIGKADLQETDTQTSIFAGLEFVRKLPQKAGNRNIKIRDAVRKAAFGMNFAVIGIESQETMDYELPLRNLSYDVGEYEKQAAGIRREVRRSSENLTSGEYLYGFKKDSRLYPVVTFILYTGMFWDGPECLHDMLDFTDIPKELRELAPDYRINLIKIREFEDTHMFRTDVKQVFDFIRCSENKTALKELVEKDAYYKEMEEDAFDVAARYANADKLVKVKNYHRKGETIDMCTAIEELIAEGRAEGRANGVDEERRKIIANMLRAGIPDNEIRMLAECDQGIIDAVRKADGRNIYG